MPHTDIMEFPIGISSNSSDSKYKANIHFTTITLPPITLKKFGNIVKEAGKQLAFVNPEVGEDTNTGAIGVPKDEDGKRSFETVTRIDKDPKPTAVDYQKSVCLYLPQAVAINNNVSYQNVDLGVIGAAAGAAVAQGKSISESLVNAVRAGTSVGNLKDPMSADYGSLIAQRLVARAGSLPGMSGLAEPAAKGISRATGVGTNPNTRSLFNQVTPRTFNFTFSMIPESPEESKMIKDIIYFFQAEMMPEEIGVGQVAYGYRFPKMFQINAGYTRQDKRGNVEYKQIMTDFLPCTLEDIQVTYNTNAQAFHADGEFTQVDMTLKFNEYRTRNKQDVDHEYKIMNEGRAADINYRPWMRRSTLDDNGNILNEGSLL